MKQLMNDSCMIDEVMAAACLHNYNIALYCIMINDIIMIFIVHSDMCTSLVFIFCTLYKLKLCSTT